MSILRSVAAVSGGYLIFVLGTVAFFQASGRNPHASQPLWFVTVSVLYGIVCAGAGGFAAAGLAPSRPAGHAAAVAVILALGATASLLGSPNTDATWSQWTALTLLAPAAYVGGRLAKRR